jgi:hypothetical protein
MKSFSALGLILLGISASADALWDKASSLIEASKAWKPVVTITTSQDKDDKGVVKDSTVTTVRYATDASGGLTKQNIRVVKNGVEGKPDAVASATKAPAGPTDPLEVSAREFTKLWPPTNVVWKGREAALYRYEFAPKSGWGLEGRIWIDKSTAIPFHRESSLNPKPPFVDEASFAQDSSWDSRGFVRDDRIDIQFVGSFLGLKKQLLLRSEVMEYGPKNTATR